MMVQHGLETGITQYLPPDSVQVISEDPLGVEVLLRGVFGDHLFSPIRMITYASCTMAFFPFSFYGVPIY